MENDFTSVNQLRVILIAVSKREHPVSGDLTMMKASTNGNGKCGNPTARPGLPAAIAGGPFDEGVRPILSSWKEIACYLGKGVRTVQRWERQLGLPVRRPKGSKSRIILAYPEELKRWATPRSPQWEASYDGALIGETEKEASM